MRFPDFICVGAQKAGTTWLYEQLWRHPQVFMRTKELDFFFRSLSLDWYSSHFTEAPEFQICGDISPNYGAFVGLAHKVKDVCPFAKIIHLLRNPVCRAVSQWKMARELGNIPLGITLIDAFRENMQYMKRRGEYITIIDEYHEFFPLNHMSAVFWYDDIRTAPRTLVQDVANFLGIDPDWESPLLYEIIEENPDKTPPPSEAIVEIAEYYEPFNARLRLRLGLNSLPWEP
jgi:hypothetical protein